MDLWSFDVRRFGPHQASRRWLHERAVESYGLYYAVHWPGAEHESARGARRSPLHATLAARGAVFGSKSGWERASSFGGAGFATRDAHWIRSHLPGGGAVRLDREDFIGQDALAAIAGRGVERRLACFTVEADRPLHGAEAIVANGEVVGVTTSGGYGYTVGRPIALGYVPVETLDGGAFEIESLGERLPATRHRRCLYDPERTKILS